MCIRDSLRTRKMLLRQKKAKTLKIAEMDKIWMKQQLKMKRKALWMSQKLTVRKVNLSQRKLVSR